MPPDRYIKMDLEEKELEVVDCFQLGQDWEK
jgi:hypothetical protein